MIRSFSHRNARSTPLLVGFAIIIFLETVGAHLILLRFSLILAIIISLLSLSALVWLIADYLALGRLNTLITDESVVLHIGRRATATIPRNLLLAAISPSWRDLPDAPNRAYLNATKPVDPNILLTFSEPVIGNLPGGVRRPVRMLALCVDTPDEFLAVIQSDERNKVASAD